MLDLSCIVVSFWKTMFLTSPEAFPIPYTSQLPPTFSHAMNEPHIDEGSGEVLALISELLELLDQCV